MKAKTIRISRTCAAPPERVLAAAYDFSDRRSEIWPNVPLAEMTVHRLDETSADVTEGTRKGPIFAWERCTYDWSTPGVVSAVVTDSNIYAVGESKWEITAAATDGGSVVEMIWTRRFSGTRLGRTFGILYRVFGANMFRGDVKRILRNIEQREREALAP